MKSAKRILLLALLVFIGAYSMGVRGSWAYNFTVNSTDDAVDANPGDTFCRTAAGKMHLAGRHPGSQFLPHFSQHYRAQRNI